MDPLSDFCEHGNESPDSIIAENFVSMRAIIIFSRRTVLHRVKLLISYDKRRTVMMNV